MKNYWNNLTGGNNTKTDSATKENSNSTENPAKPGEAIDERKGKVYEKYEDEMDPYRVLRD